MIAAVAATAALTVLAFTASAASGQPSWKTEGISLSCTLNGETLGTATFSGGVGPNHSPIAFVVSDVSFATAHSIFIQVLVTVTFGGETFTTIDKHFPAHKNLITCTGGNAPVTITATGFLTPAP